MKPTALKTILALALCTPALQAQAQNVQPNRTSQVETIATLDFKKSIEQTPKVWQKSKYYGQDKQKGLQEILNATKEQFKNPRLQKFGGMDGGGGNALICDVNGQKSAILLDLYEAQQSDVEIDMGEGAFEDKLDYVFKRLSKVTLVHAAHYAALAKNLLTKDTQWVENSTMPTIDDVKIATLPRGCALVQVAIQRPLEQKNVPNARTYIIDKDVFNLLDENSKAALVLHEVLYRTARYSDKADSVFVRHLTALISSDTIRKYKKESFNQLLLKNGITCNEHEYLPVLKSFENSLSCGYEDEANVKINISAIISPYRNTTVFSDLKGRLENFRHEFSHTQAHTLALKFGEDTVRMRLRGLEVEFGLTENTLALPQSNFANLRKSINFSLIGETTASYSQVKNLSVKIRNSQVLLAGREGTTKIIFGNARIDLPYLKLDMVSGGLDGFFNNYVMGWNEAAITTGPNAEMGLRIAATELTPYLEDSLTLEQLKQKEKGHLTFKLKVPSELNLKTDANGWINVVNVTFDSKGNLFEMLFDDGNTAGIYNFRTKTLKKLN